jgi:tRNA modification GTPase
LQSLCALLEVDLDFSEEGISVIGKPEIESRLQEVKERLELLAETFKAGKVYRDGVSVVIAGPPNAGKSSLFNALLKESRAIVTPVAGTTRDYLEESLALEGILFRLTDTAGLRKSDNPVEIEGITRTLKSLESADIVILVQDAHQAYGREDMAPGSLPIRDAQEVIYVRNKIDLLPGEEGNVRTLESPAGLRREVSLSALKGTGVHELARQLTRIVAETGVSSHETLCVISERHAESLLKGAHSLKTALSSLQSGMTNEFVAFDVRESLAALGEITGEITSEDVLNSIFGEFCIGK